MCSSVRVDTEYCVSSSVYDFFIVLSVSVHGREKKYIFDG